MKYLKIVWEVIRTILTVLVGIFLIMYGFWWFHLGLDGHYNIMVKIADVILGLFIGTVGFWLISDVIKMIKNAIKKRNE